MANGWTPERRARQAEAIRRWQPWAKSTGPRTNEGKARAKMNGYRGGHWRELRELSKQMNALLRTQRDELGELAGEAVQSKGAALRRGRTVRAEFPLRDRSGS